MNDITRSARAKVLMLAAALAGLLMPATAPAASFSCAVPAAEPLEQAVCGDAELSRLDEDLGHAYALLRRCQAPREAAALRQQQRTWLRETRALHAASTEPLALLKIEWRERARALDALARRCAAARGLRTKVAVKFLEDPALNLSVPFFETDPPNPGRRMNDAVFERWFDSPAPGSAAEGLRGLPEPYTTGAARPLAYFTFRVVHQDLRLLALQVDGEGCGAYCSAFREQMLFDLRSGRWVAPEELFTPEGARVLGRRLATRQLRQARAIVRDLARRGEDVQGYERCLQEWPQSAPRVWPMEHAGPGLWRFGAPDCSVHANRGEDALDRLHHTLPIRSLLPWLSPYGRSLLLGEGDVLDPLAPTLRCEPPAAPLDPGRAAEVVQVQAGHEHWLLLQRDGRLWSWGGNHDGQLGLGEPAGRDAVPVPTLVGTGYTQIGAAGNASAALRADGSVWTWGSNYANALGRAGSRRQPEPGRLQEGVRTVRMDTQTGLALAQDGRLLMWGYNQGATPQAVAEGVAAAQFTGAAGSYIRHDGTLWTRDARVDGGWRWLGARFRELPVAGANVALRDDGSVWGWREDGAIERMADGGFTRLSAVRGGSVAGVKADGSLWVTQSVGRAEAMVPQACGFADVLVVSDSGTRPGIAVLGLRADGTLVVWGRWRDAARGDQWQGLLARPPRLLASGVGRVLPGGGLHGSLGAHALVVKTDGSVWRWRLPDRGGEGAPPALAPLPFAGGVLPP